MDPHAAGLDWNRLRAFLATVDAGSLSAAARLLGLTQPTLGRQVTALEQELGAVLFERSGRGLVLTPTGRELLEQVRPMADAAARLALVAAGRSQAIEGTVRITATEAYAAHVLPPVIAKLRAQHPGMRVEIMATNRNADLLRREADIAIRNVAPLDAELIARKVGDDRGRPYGTPSVLDRLDRPRTLQDLAAAGFVGFGDPDDFIDGVRAFGLQLSRQLLPVVADSYLVHWALVRQGAGIGFMTEAVGDAEPAVRRALPDAAPIVFPVWLVTHRELHTSRRIRVAFDLLAEALGSVFGAAPVSSR